MAFDFQPLNQTRVEMQDSKPPVLGIFSRWLFATVILAVVGVFFWTPAKEAIKSAMARSYAKESIAAMHADDFGYAITQLRDARSYAPEEPAVLEAIIEYLKLVKGDPREIAYNLRVLSGKRTLTSEEQILYADSLVRSGQAAEARKTFDKLPAADAQSTGGLAVLAQIQAAEGQRGSAAATARQARLLDKTTPEARIEIAVENSRSAFPELRQKSWQELWELAQLAPPPGIAAMRALIKDPRLSAEDAARLLTLIEQHPHAEPAARLEVISTLMGLLPEQREDFIRREVARFESRDHVGERGGLVELAAWLAEHQAYTELHRLVPRHLARSSRELYTALVKALASEGRWQDMKSLLNEERPPVSPTLIKLWLADAESHLQPDGREARRQILLAIDCARTAHEAEELELASGLAERLGWTDIALQAVKYLLPEAPHRQGDLLSRARGLAARSQDTHSLLEITRDLLALHPESTQYADDLAYLRLLLGEEMEIVSLGGKKLPSFYAALNAYRLGDGAALPQLLTHTSNTEGLPAGRRAVLSGLLAKAGETARAFQIAEKVPDALLLDEERVFLKMAR